MSKTLMMDNRPTMQSCLANSLVYWPLYLEDSLLTMTSLRSDPGINLHNAKFSWTKSASDIVVVGIVYSDFEQNS